MTELLLALILFYSAEYNIEPELALAIVATESSFNQYAIGAPEGSIGYMQLNPRWYKGYSKKQLFDPEINIQLGIKHLAIVKEQCHFRKKNMWVICYNAGVFGATKIKYPKKSKYYKRVMRYYTKYMKEGMEQ